MKLRSDGVPNHEDAKTTKDGTNDSVQEQEQARTTRLTSWAVNANYIFVGGGLLFVWAAMVLSVALVSDRPGVSMTFVEYKRWPHGAKLRLTNGTPRGITYCVEPQDSVESPVLFLQKNSRGEVSRLRCVFSMRDLSPGKSLDFFVLLEPGAPPKHVGTICYVPQSKLSLKLQPWIVRVKRWFGVKAITIAPPGQTEVWCPTPLASPAEPGEGN